MATGTKINTHLMKLHADSGTKNNTQYHWDYRGAGTKISTRNCRKSDLSYMNKRLVISMMGTKHN